MINAIPLLLGHLVGDYVLQTHEMAQNKNTLTARGDAYLTLHVLLYSSAVALFTVVLGGWRTRLTVSDSLSEPVLIALFIAGLSHWWIDRHKLAYKWMTWYGNTLEGPFFPVVYCVIDNTMHLILMYLAFTWLGTN